MFSKSKSVCDDYVTYSGKLNRDYERFKISKFKACLFKYLLIKKFRCGQPHHNLNVGWTGALNDLAGVHNRILAFVESQTGYRYGMIGDETFQFRTSKWSFELWTFQNALQLAHNNVLLSHYHLVGLPGHDTLRSYSYSRTTVILLDINKFNTRRRNTNQRFWMCLIK